MQIKLESHPGKELKDHLQNVTELAGQKMEQVNFSFKNYSRETLQKLLQLICMTHDFGKATDYFQEYLNEKRPGSELTKHARFSAVWAYILVKREMNDEKLAAFAYYLVYRHHGELVNFNEALFTYDKDERYVFTKQLECFRLDYINDNLGLSLNKNSFSEILEDLDSSRFRRVLRGLQLTEEEYYLINFLFSLLIDADKGEAIFNQSNKDFAELLRVKTQRFLIEPKAVDRYKEKKFQSQKTELDKMRNAIYREAEINILASGYNNKIFSINVPTGTGKTLTALNAALKLREKMEQKPRIIYMLPYTSIIDQNYEVFEDVLGNPDSSMLIKDHHLAEKIYRQDEEKYEYDISEYLTESWDSEVIVTTFVQFLHSLLTDRNRSLKKFANIANSIILLDEVQTIPHKYWKLVKETLQNMCNIFNCRVILMTATMPLIFSEADGEIIELVKSKREHFEKLNRITLFINKDEQSKMKSITQYDFNNLAIENMVREKDKSFLFIFNTIQSSLDYYHCLKNNDLDREIIYLSTNIIPKHRLERINRIKQKKGTNFIIVSTQMVEAGVDIDIDRVYRDFGPLDSINQAAGRCNRNGVNEKGLVYIFRLQNEKSREYCGFIYNDVLLHKTESVLNGLKSSQIEEKCFFDIANRYYSELKNALSEDVSNKINNFMKTLQYRPAFHKNDENGGIYFQLINDDVPSGEVFIEWDDEAVDLFKKYEKMKTLPKFERKAFFSSFKKEFLDYVIQVPKKYLPDKDKIDYIQRIGKDELENSYCLENGYIRYDPSVATW
jgi:CRISPR-associated endonuclease/helicase Cas3